MIGIMVIAHAPLASAMAECMVHIHGARPVRSAFLDIYPQISSGVALTEARAAVTALDEGQGVLILTDLFGASPANIAGQLVLPGQVEVVTGLNLPMLLRAHNYRLANSLELLVDKALAGATAGVMKIASTAQQNQRNLPADTKDAHARLHNQQ